MVINEKRLKAHERRTFPRVELRAYATLITTEERWPAHLIDLSFHGAMIAIVHKHSIKDGEDIQLSIEIDAQKPLKLYGHVAHQKEHMLGIECRANGIDEQQKLRKLVGKDPSSDYMNRSVQHMMGQHDSL